MSDEKVIDKIKKLLAIAKDNNAFDGEIQAAMHTASKLMDKYHLTEEDLSHEPVDDYRKAEGAEKGRYRAFIGAKIYAWEQDLATFVSKFVGVPAYIDNNKLQARSESGFLLRDKWFGEPWAGKSIVFYGVAEDAIIARDLYDELRWMITTLAYGKFGNIYVKEGGKYSEGFVWGLFEQHAKSKEVKKLEAQTSSTGMILLARRDDLVQFKQDLASKWLKAETKVKIHKGGRNWGAAGSSNAFGQGVKDGKNADVEVARTKKLN
jgi:hypothetical protein